VSAECSCTVSYGPTFSCLVTVTVIAPALPLAKLSALEPPPRLGQLGAGAQFCGGAGICVAVSASKESKRTSALRPTSTVPRMGSTHANDDGFPAYSS